MAIGNDAEASSVRAVAIGNGAKADATKPVVIQIDENLSAHIPYGSPNWVISSDERVKNIIGEADTALCLEGVNKLKVKRYSFKPFAGKFKDVHQTGFIAQEMEEVFPKSVFTSKETFINKDENGNTIYKEDGVTPETIAIDDFRSIDRESLIPVLWGAVQELSKQVEELKEKLKNS